MPRNEIVNDHDPLCPHRREVKLMVGTLSCVHCQLIREVTWRERRRQFPDPFAKYGQDVDGMPE